MMVYEFDDLYHADSGVASVLRAHLLEQIIQCLLMKGDTANSAEKVWIVSSSQLLASLLI